jgi:hypothetical protein
MIAAQITESEVVGIKNQNVGPVGSRGISGGKSDDSEKENQQGTGKAHAGLCVDLPGRARPQ